MGERESETEGEIDLLFFLFMHSLVDLVCALTRGPTCNLGLSGQCSNQLSYLALQEDYFVP